MVDGIALLREARAAGLKVEADGSRLVIRGPRNAEALARRLLARKDEVLHALAHERDVRVLALNQARRALREAVEAVARRRNALPADLRPELPAVEDLQLEEELNGTFRARDVAGALAVVEAWTNAWEAVLPPLEASAVPVPAVLRALEDGQLPEWKWQVWAREAQRRGIVGRRPGAGDSGAPVHHRWAAPSPKKAPRVCLICGAPCTEDGQPYRNRLGPDCRVISEHIACYPRAREAEGKRRCGHETEAPQDGPGARVNRIFKGGSYP